MTSTDTPSFPAARASGCPFAAGGDAAGAALGEKLVNPKLIASAVEGLLRPGGGEVQSTTARSTA
ncbi:hypothetical protein [Amycolatopsis pittospori]|uniref:hypothetical protein n=1 Tax=Amycolatopsis pittospori TaxID=2749434 RepID=UPI0015EFE862|nr:hypothetical protein [Amycolatopsis pittospori]